MSAELLIEAGPIETRIALVEDGRLTEFRIERDEHPSLVGSIWLGRVTRIATGVQAAFVDLGLPRAGFLNAREAQALKPDGAGLPIEKLLHEGQAILVQVRKDAQGDKGVGLSTLINLPGRLLVYTPHDRTVSVSRRIASMAERARLQLALADLSIGGAVIRTAAEGVAEAVVRAEAERLAAEFAAMQQDATRVKAPACLWQEPDAPARAVRDRLTASLDRVLVDNADIYSGLRRQVARDLPDLRDRIELHKGPAPLFARHQLAEQIAQLAMARVALPSGGAITIEPTRALTAIDIDSGSDTAGPDLERTALRTNMEAADEIARQLRLRDIGGIVVIDFIQLASAESRERLMGRLRAALAPDRAPVRIGELSDFGLVELTRRRSGEALHQRLETICDACAGTGRRTSVEAAMADALRALAQEAAALPGRKLTLRLSPEVAERVSAHGRASEWLRSIGVAITITADARLSVGQQEIVVT